MGELLATLRVGGRNRPIRLIKRKLMCGGRVLTMRQALRLTGGLLLGEGDTGYTIEPELFASDGRLLHHHRRGVVAMAREGDDVNPERRSSGCQFYIVWGKTFSTTDLMSIGERLDAMTQHRVVMTPEMTTLYRKTGGTPHLDGQYTVFGEVIEGLDVVNRIQQAFTDDYDRPVDDIRILRATVTRPLPQP